MRVEIVHHANVVSDALGLAVKDLIVAQHLLTPKREARQSAVCAPGFAQAWQVLRLTGVGSVSSLAGANERDRQ